MMLSWELKSRSPENLPCPDHIFPKSGQVVGSTFWQDLETFQVTDHKQISKVYCTKMQFFSLHHIILIPEIWMVFAQCQNIGNLLFLGISEAKGNDIPGGTYTA